MTLFSNQACDRDTKVTSGGVSTRNYGTSVTILGGTSDKMLLWWDLSSIPSGSVVNSATLTLYQAGAAAANAFTLTAYAIKSGNGGWIEGTKNNATAGTGEPCWDYKEYNTVAWAGSAGLSTAGTDYDSSSIGTVNGNRSDANGTAYAITLTGSALEAMIAGGNYGILVVTSSGCGAIASAENSTSGYRPKLEIDYTEPSSGISGTASISLDEATTAASGTLAIAGSAGPTLDGATLSAAGTVAIAGSSAPTLDAVTISAAGVLPLAGVSDPTLDGTTISAAGTLAITGSAGPALDGVTISAAGVSQSITTGALDASLDAVTISGAGSLALTGDLSQSLAGVTLSADAVVALTGVAPISIDGIGVQASGALVIAGASGINLAAVVLTAIGTSTIVETPATRTRTASLDHRSGAKAGGSRVVVVDPDERTRQL